MTRGAILQIHARFLRGLLHLPIEAEITGIRVDSGQREDVLEVRIAGAGWETPEGTQLIRTSGMVEVDSDLDIIRIDWGFPP